jgi:hypothetical protein
MCFFLISLSSLRSFWRQRREGNEKNTLNSFPFSFSVIFFASIMKTFRKAHFLPPQHSTKYFLWKNFVRVDDDEQKTAAAEKYKKKTMNCSYTAFFCNAFPDITIERQKTTLRLRNSFAEEFYFFLLHSRVENFFFEKKSSSSKHT